jgi:D-glycero-alpha-D-manno-heptose 1-phosphate guanylyltransferase
LIQSALLLAGGAGTRIRHLHPDVPKPLIPVAGQPFLEWVLRFWSRHGISRFVVSLGHLSARAEAYLASRNSGGVDTLRENAPLGTGGAIAFAAANASLGDPFVAANADSVVAADLSSLMPMLRDDALDAVIVGLPVADASRYGTLEIDRHGHLAGFHEKRSGAGLINGGIYFLKHRLLQGFDGAVPLSMERDVFPEWIRRGARIRVTEVSGEFLDIGTPESLLQAEEFLLRNKSFFQA